MLIDFLKTQRSKAELQTALTILREFKACESTEEWVCTMFAVWIKLEELEEYLAHLVEDAELHEDTKRMIAKVSSPLEERAEAPDFPHYIVTDWATGQMLVSEDGLIWTPIPAPDGVEWTTRQDYGSETNQTPPPDGRAG